MRHYFYCRIRWLLLYGFLAGICGCASLMDVTPTPPGFLARVDLSGPFDAYIPPARADQIKSAGLLQDSAVPYLFLSVAAGFESKGDPEKSIHFFNRSIAEFRKRGNPYGEATAWSRKIAAFLRLGEAADALRCIQEIESKWSGTQLKAVVLYNYGYYYSASGDPAKALDYLARALFENEDYKGNPDLTALRRDTELERGRALFSAEYFPVLSTVIFPADWNEAFLQDVRRNVAISVTHLERALVLNNDLRQTPLLRYFPEWIPSHLECDLQNYLGLAYGIQGRSTLAVSHLEEASDMARRTGYLLGEADSVFFLNQVYLLDKNAIKGGKAALDLKDIACRNQLLSYTIWAEIIEAHHFRAAGDIRRASDSAQSALILLQQHETWLSVFTGFRGVRFFQPRAIREALFDLQIQHGDHRGAFRTAERIKALTLTYLCDPGRTGKTPVAARARKMSAYHQSMAKGYLRLLSPVNAPSVFGETAEAIRQTQSTFSDARASMEKSGEGLLPLICSDPPDADALQQLLEQHTTLFSYYFGAQFLYVWVISKKGFHQIIIRMSRQDVERMVQAYHQAVISRDKNRIDAWSEKVYDTILRPVIPFVHGDRLGIVPHGPLYRLSFASMRYMKAYLVDGFSIYYLPHTGMMTQAPPSGAVAGWKRWLTVADTRTGKKETVSRFADHSELLNASGGDLLKTEGRYDVIDWDLDCYMSDVNPLTSGIYPASNRSHQRYLSASDLLGLSVKGRMSIARACHTDESASMTGAGLATLAGALFEATPSVLISLWPVDDNPRTVLLEHLYKQFDKNEKIADALRAAQNAMIQAGASPSDWAGYLLFGRP